MVSYVLINIGLKNLQKAGAKAPLSVEQLAQLPSFLLQGA
jgi:hypothetical protein